MKKRTLAAILLAAMLGATACSTGASQQSNDTTALPDAHVTAAPETTEAPETIRL